LWRWPLRQRGQPQRAGLPELRGRQSELPGGRSHLQRRCRGQSRRGRRGCGQRGRHLPRRALRHHGSLSRVGGDRASSATATAVCVTQDRTPTPTTCPSAPSVRWERPVPGKELSSSRTASTARSASTGRTREPASARSARRGPSWARRCARSSSTTPQSSSRRSGAGLRRWQEGGRRTSRRRGSSTLAVRVGGRAAFCTPCSTRLTGSGSLSARPTWNARSTGRDRLSKSTSSSSKRRASRCCMFGDSESTRSRTLARGCWSRLAPSSRPVFASSRTTRRTIRGMEVARSTSKPTP